MIEQTTEYRKAITADARKTYIKAVIDISDPDIVFLEPIATSTAPWTKPEEIHDKFIESPARYGTLEPNRWLLDGSFSIFPDNYKVPTSLGYAMDELSQDDGSFSVPQVITQPMENLTVLQAMSVYFSGDVLDGLAVDFKVEISQGDTIYFSKEVTGNKSAKVSFEDFTVYNPDFIRLTITKWSLPVRRVRCVEIIPGIFEEWTGDNIKKFDVEQNGDFSCLTIPYGSCDITIDNLDRRFEPRNKNGIFQSVEERQKIDVSIGTKLEDGSIDYKKIGTYYQFSDGWKTGTNAITMDWSLVDIVGLLANREFIPPDTLPTTLGGWLQAFVSQLGDNFENRYHVDPQYSDAACTASLEDVQGKSVGELLRYACMATGTWPRADAETGYLTAEPLWDQGNKYDLDNMSVYPVMKANTSIAALIFTLNDGNDTQFIVSGNSTSSEQTVSINNPFIHSSAEALTAARLILSCYGGNTMELTGRGDPSSEIGDVDIVWLNESTASTGRRMKQGFSFVDGVLRNCKSTLLQADGSYLYQESAIITESGSWTAPAGITQLRIIVVGGGRGGEAGDPGDWDNAGSPGGNGTGGKVLVSTIAINEGQTFQISIGTGGAGGVAHGTWEVIGQGDLESDKTYGWVNLYKTEPTDGTPTKFGEYSSENGGVYENGYSDVASGKSYARPGVAVPVPGTGDGGKGGDGGAQGARYILVPEDKYGQPAIWETISDPELGKQGANGTSGCVVIYWDKEV